MKRIYIALICALLLSVTVSSQDARQRTPQTIVADVLAELPVNNTADFDATMADLASTGETGVIQLADMLVPATDGKNNLVEYALNGLVAYVSGHGTESQIEAVRAGLSSAIDRCGDTANKAFLLTLLPRISHGADMDVFMKYINDPALTEYAQSGIILTEGCDDAVLQLFKEDKLPHAVLARIAGAKGLTAAEPVLISWLPGADATTVVSICKALARTGTAKSLQVLAKAAAKEGYQWKPDGDATTSLAELLNRLAPDAANRKTVTKHANDLLKKSNSTNVRTAALAAIMTAKGKDASKQLLKAMESADRQYRVAALRHCEPWADESLYAALGAIASSPKTDAQTRTDIINWLGTNKVSSQTDVILPLTASADSETAEAAITAASRIGGAKSLVALIEALSGANHEAAYRSLLRFNGKIDQAVTEALNDKKQDTQVLCHLLKLASTRRIQETAPSVFGLLPDSDPTVAAAAYEALPGVVSANDINTLCKLTEQAGNDRLPMLQKAIISAMEEFDADKKYETIRPYATASKNPAAYYPVLASAGTTDAIAMLTEAYGNPTTSNAALAALLTVDDPSMMDIMYDIATGATTDAVSDKALSRYARLVAKYGDNPITKYQLYRRGIEASRTPESANVMLRGLAGTGTYQALMIADKYAGDPTTADMAADAIRSIMSKHIDEYSGPEVKGALEKAAAQFATHKNDPDAGYAVDDIKGMLARLEARKESVTAPSSQLTDKEKSEGWEILFDGRSLYKWTGDTVSYRVVDGCIDVTSKFGGNLYTVDQFGDFVLRFEFSLDREGVNNGIGIRTPMGVDAAYHGMEIQILDHDAPMYKNLAPYQVHGSVYGVIPAKRIKFEHGKWNTEEIRAEGDRITVTVNGRVILDGNIREACQGHAVSEDGSEENPWTTDHRNHPGLFNKSGHIGLLGHGAGIRFRNIRVLDLGK